MFEGALKSKFLERADGAVERDPSHDLGMGELLAFAAHLPDSFVRLSPDLFEVGTEGGLHRPTLGLSGDPVLARDVERVEQLAVDVDLQLF